ncbi:subtilisin-like protease sbt5.4 [Nicotiana attenuata]|uniref:Subtilisin-like protease sbt5.4 n=1 Tax=Nicotiana attenuata TaxID=49451 RepID=A0A314KTL6_NICAT|nr:subtilisin-like protease sbt5.4 [Nicotiana attenuata]
MGNECFDSDILVAFDMAIDDGMDVLSVSLGGDAGAYVNDCVAIGSFHVVKHGIVVVTSAGNSGPGPAKAPHASTDDAHLCKAGALDPKKVKGSILVCLRGDNARVDKGKQAALAGSVGIVLANDYASGDEIIADSHVLPATQISYTDGLELFTYVNSTSTPTASITHPTTQLGTKPAPVMAAFSSIRPNTVTPEILKDYQMVTGALAKGNLAICDGNTGR